MDLYRIVNWGETFENNRTRELKRMDWLPIKNKHDGDGFTELMDHPNGMAHYGAWMLIVQVASKCDPRGTLLRDGAKPYDAQSLARVTRGSAKVFTESIPRLIKIGWIEVIPCNSESCADVAADVAASCGEIAPRCGEVTMEWNGREGKGREGNNKAPPSGEESVLSFPQNLRTPQFADAWGRWVPFRKKVKSCKDWRALFQEQLDWLGAFPERDAIAILGQSIRNGWQGLFELKEKGNNNGQRVPEIDHSKGF